MEKHLPHSIDDCQEVDAPFLGDLVMKRRALIVEDDLSLARLVKLHLSDVNCDADLVHSGDQALEKYRSRHYDIVVLDLMLPGQDGLSVCREIRNCEGYVPILMLTAKSSELDRVLGLEMGADDYLTKPFSIPELVARVKALFRRAEAMSNIPESTDPNEKFNHCGLRIEVGKRSVTARGESIVLTAKEFDLLLHFARHPGQVFNRTQLLDQVWGYNHEGYEHTVNSHINRLRGKIEPDPAKPAIILTVWGVGYKMSEA